MPHQCLKCGKSYPEGTAQILKGCQECGGTKFFYTKKPLDDQKRKKIQKETEQNTESIMEHLLQGNLDNTQDADSRPWLQVKPRKVQEIMNEVAQQKKEVTQSLSQEDRIESISVKDLGEYDINIKKLLQEESVIVQKDGSYLIHLPSVFKEARKKK